MKDSVEVSARERLVSAVVGEPAAFFFYLLACLLAFQREGNEARDG